MFWPDKDMAAKTNRKERVILDISVRLEKLIHRKIITIL
jgi:hypothetical protein